SPYLDKELFEFAYSIPAEYLVQQGYNKYILREAVKGILNEQVRLDRKKVGFNASIKSVIDLAQKGNLDYLLDDGPIYEWFDKDKIAALFKMDPLPDSYNKFIFSFINAKIFLELNA